MTTTEADQLEDGLVAGFDIVRELARLVEDARSPEDYLRRLPNALAAHFRSPLAGVTYGLESLTVQETHADDFESCASWQGPLGAAILEAEREGRTFARVFDLPDGSHVGLFALPVRLDGIGSGGALGLLANLTSKDVAEAMLSELRALIGLFEYGTPHEWSRSTPSQASEATSIGAELGSLSKASGYATLHQFAFAITNNLRTKLDCEQVTLSQVVGQRVKVLSISGIDDPKPRTPGIVELTQAQEECVDHGEPIFVQATTDWDEALSTRHRLHAQWREAAGGANVGSIPLCMGERVVAVLSVRRPPSQPFSPDEVDSCRKRVEPFARSIEMLRRGERGLAQHAAEQARLQLAELRAPGARTKKVLLAALCLAVLWFAFGSMSVRRPVVAHVAAREVVHLAAPFHAAIAEVFVEEGAHVAAGAPLARLDTRALELEQAELEAERDSHRVEVDQHLAAGDLVHADLARARERVTRARLASVARRIGEAVLRAPANGVILRGEVSGRTGDVVPQGEPLFEFVAHGSLRLELDVPEAFIDELTPGVGVRFAANAAPELTRRGAVEIVGAAAQVRDGHNVFVSMAGFDETQDLSWLRVGMEGVAKLDVGSRPVRSIALERLTQAFYQTLWL